MNQTFSPYGAVRPPAKQSPGGEVAVWAALILLALACAAVAVVAVWLVFFGYSAGCNEVADTETILKGMGTLFLVLAFAACPWAIGCIWSTRYRVAIAVAGAIAIAPVLLGLAIGLGDGAWDNGWCF